MFNIVNRCQNSFGYFTSVLMAFSAAVAIVSFIQLHLDGAYGITGAISNVNPTVNVKFTRRFGSTDGKAKENARLTFDLETDLAPLFNWNTKQVFVQLTAEYPGARPDISNRVTFWDKIVKRKEDSVLSLSNSRGRYSVYDTGKSFNEKNATLRLEWNVQPYVGLLTYGEVLLDGDTSFQFPALRAAKEN
uniref:Signal peptidase subunit 3 n=1 Tax=Blastobotrys adeninivorans TaxID=409370 RepID=A0A060SXB0_BLAAD